ncbi:uncharacterized protein LOC126766064 [Bactrocera neohumeralis]|uniref:uncharacterized protein LOC126766064 n=1 Tax=Bactrocera neohumeralis TaxID=98809 RepID=UPI0021661036|nr:uncharacterized protein LOC126766064 [Bactrocera neohumeralis]
MEKILDQEIRSKALETTPLHANQHAYRAGRSTNTALYQLTSEIQSSLDTGEVTLCAFLDIEGAFDNASHGSVARALEKRNVAPTVRRWIEAVLRTRIAETTSGGTTIRLGTTKGCPQGGVLSPLLWSLVVDELLVLLTNNGIRCQGYADDIVIIARGKFVSTLCDIVQRGLGLAKGWCNSVGLNINPLKTTIVPFTRRRSLPGLRNLTLGGREIEMTNMVKYLGLTLNSTLRWKQHIDLTMVKATKALMVCNRLAGRSWGCKPRIIRWLYTMIVRPIVTYGAVVVALKLSKLQRLACVCMTGAMRTCPTAALEALLELTPLHLLIGQVAKYTLLQMTAEGTGIGKIISSQRMEELSGIIPLAPLPRDGINKKLNFTKKFKITLGSKAEWSDSAFELLLRDSSIRWYTDGSKTSEGIGAGVAGPRTKLSIPMGKFPSIFQAEVFAISRCVELNLQRGYRNERIAILSDSQAALKAISSYEIKSLLVQECIDRLNSLAECNQVHLIWVPGHRGIAGNELADELARSAASTSMVGPEPFIAVGPHTIKEQVRNDVAVGGDAAPMATKPSPTNGSDKTRTLVGVSVGSRLGVTGAKPSAAVVAKGGSFIRGEIASTSRGTSARIMKGSTGNKSKAALARKLKSDRRLAAKILERYGDKHAGQVSEQHASTLEWAKKVLSEDDRVELKTSRTEPAVKRQRSHEGETSLVKKPRTGKAPTFSEIAKGAWARILGVLDRSREDGAMSHDEWKRVAAAISSVFLRVVKENPGPPPKCCRTMEIDPDLSDVASVGGGSSIGDSVFSLERLFEEVRVDHDLGAEIALLEESLKDKIPPD